MIGKMTYIAGERQGPRGCMRHNYHQGYYYFILTVLCEELSRRVPVYSYIWVQSQGLSTPHLAHLCLTTVTFRKTAFDKLLQRRRTPEHLRELGIVDLEPVIDPHGLALFGLSRCRDQREGGQEGDVVLAEGRGEEVADDVDLVLEEGVQHQVRGGDEGTEGRPVGGRLCCFFLCRTLRARAFCGFGCGFLLFRLWGHV